MKILRMAAAAVGLLASAAMHAWATLALALADPPRPWTRTVVVVLYVGAVAVDAVLFVRAKRRLRIAAASLLPFAAVVAWFSTLETPEPRSYPPEASRTPRAEIDGSRVTLRDVRNMKWTTWDKGDARFETRTYDLDRLRTVDVAMCYWDDWQEIVHPIVCFGFEGGEALALSVERRVAAGAEASDLASFFKHYEPIYVWADEKDVVGVRATLRNERVYLWRTSLGTDVARRFLLELLARTNAAAERPAFYDGAFANCITPLMDALKRANGGLAAPWRYGVLLGRADGNAFRAGLLLAKEPDFESAKAAADIVPRAKAATTDAADFSRRIRTHF